MNPKVNYGLWVITIDLWRSVICDKHTPLVEDVDGKAMHIWGQGIYGKSLYLPLNFAVNLKLLLINTLIKKKIVFVFQHPGVWLTGKSFSGHA